MKALDRRPHCRHGVGAGRLLCIGPGEQHVSPGKVVADVVLIGDRTCLSGVVKRQTVLPAQGMLHCKIRQRQRLGERVCQPVCHLQRFASTPEGLIGEPGEPECMGRPRRGQHAEVSAHQRHMLGVLGFVISADRALIRWLRRHPVTLLDQAPHDVGPCHRGVGTRPGSAQSRDEFLAQAPRLGKLRTDDEKEGKADLGARLLTEVARLSAELHGAPQWRVELRCRPPTGNANRRRKVELQCQRLPGALLRIDDLIGLRQPAPQQGDGIVIGVHTLRNAGRAPIERG